MMTILQAGLYTSIQDQGRYGYRNIGVPISGVMDHFHASLANRLLNNPSDAAVLEITLQGPKLQFERATSIVITGANLSPTLNDIVIKNNEIIPITEGDILSFGKRIYGVRAYLAVLGGFKTPIVMNSRSYYAAISGQSVIKNHDIISYLPNDDFIGNSNVSISSIKEHFNTNLLSVYKGPEYELLSKQQKESLRTQAFTIGLNNRMAYQLVESLTNDLPTMITSGVLPGTVQLTPSGKLIILMADCQTTGGYPRVLQLSDESLANLAQKMRGDVVGFSILNTDH